MYFSILRTKLNGKLKEEAYAAFEKLKVPKDLFPPVSQSNCAIKKKLDT